MDGYTFILKSRLRAIIYHVNKKPIRSAPGFVISLATTFGKLVLVFIVFCVVDVTVAASFAVFEMSDNFLLNDGAKKRITIHKQINGNNHAHTAALYSSGEPCKWYITFHAPANQ